MNKLVLFIAFFWLIGITIKLSFGFDSNQMVFSEILIEPNYSSWLGRDDYGRDIFHRLIDGFINSFEISPIIFIGLTILTIDKKPFNLFCNEVIKLLLTFIRDLSI